MVALGGFDATDVEMAATEVSLDGGEATAAKMRTILETFDALGCPSADSVMLRMDAVELAGALCAAVDKSGRAEAAAELLGKEAAGARARNAVRAGLLRGFDGPAAADVVAEAQVWLEAKSASTRARWPRGVGAAVAIQAALTARARRERAAELAEQASAVMAGAAAPAAGM